MNIAWCHNAVTGGAKRAAYEFVRELSRRGHILDEFIVADQPVDDYLPLSPFIRTTHRTILCRPEMLTLRPYLLETTAACAAQWVRSRLEEAALRHVAGAINRQGYDLVNIDQHPFCRTAGLLPYLRRPAVVYSHEASIDRYRAAQEPGILAEGRRLKAWYHRWCKAPLTLTDRLQRRRGMGAKICYYGVDHECFRPLGLPVEPMVLSVALLGAAQRPRVVVAAPEAEAGQREAARLQDLAAGRQVELEILYAPDQAELVRWYNRALAVAFVPQMEPFGLVALEAMACGTPVVGVREGGLRESVVHGLTGLLVERDPRQIAGAIRALRTQPDLRARMGRQAVERVRAEWTWARAVDRYEAAVREYLEAVGWM
jgi:glycosyltransferase involved in cell wall biosynthesis